MGDGQVELSAPLVSVIMPAFNAEEYIRSAIASVQSQSLPDWELVVVDDCSSDDTVSIVRTLARDDPRIRLFCLSVNSGAAAARNLAIANSSGRFIAFLDADDTWVDSKLEIQIGLMRDEGVAFSCAAYLRSECGRDRVVKVGVPRFATYDDIAKNCTVGCLTAVFDTHVFGRAMMPDISKRQDFALWLALLRRIDGVRGIQTPLGIYRVRKGSVSSSKISVFRYNWIVYRRVERLSFFRSVGYFLPFAFNGIFKTYIRPLVGRKIDS